MSDLPRTRYVKSGEVHIAYQVLGDGPINLLWVPGFVSHLEYDWEHPRPARFFRRLASFSRLIRFDKRAPGADSIAVRPESQISIKTGALPNQQEIERRREIVRHFFNDFWISAEDKPGTFAERLNRAEGHINERLAARGETWQLDAARNS